MKKEIVVCSFIFAIIAIAIASSVDTDVSFEVVINNTNLAPTAVGHPNGTGERITNELYWANSSTIEIFVYAHANSASNPLQIILNVNNITIEHSELRATGQATSTHAYVTGIIPKGSNYSVNISNAHHYEWREWAILSGKNGTLTINQTFINISGSSVDNSTIQINESQVNNLTTDLNSKVNKTGDTMTGNLSIGTIIGNNQFGEIFIYGQNGKGFSRLSSTVNRFTFNSDIAFSDTFEENTSTEEISDRYAEHNVKETIGGNENYSKSEWSVLNDFQFYKTSVRHQTDIETNLSDLELNPFQYKLDFSNGNIDPSFNFTSNSSKLYNDFYVNDRKGINLTIRVTNAETSFVDELRFTDGILTGYISDA